MEKIVNRDLYFRGFIEFCDLVDLNTQFMSALDKHRYFSDEMRNVVQKLTTDKEKKLFILVWFTRSRSTCDEIIRILLNSGQREAADILIRYNTSSGPMLLINTADIPLRESKSPLIGSSFYLMAHKPRGMCVIINNVNEELFLESQRFDYIFKKLHFNVNVFTSLDALEMEDKLKQIAGSVETSDAFVLMIISHGSDENVLGYKACNALKTVVSDPNNSRAKEVLNSDVIEVKKIVDIFSNTNCENLKYKPKVFFFTCCRNKSCIENSGQQVDKQNEEPLDLAKPFTEVTTHDNRKFDKLKSLDDKWMNNNRDTFICYSCAEGYKSFYDPKVGISNFGQALSHCIAQYACEETLNSIISRTCDYLQQYSDQSGNYAPEFRGNGMRRQLSFNP